MGVCFGGTQQDFVCRRTYLLDPNIIRELNVDGSNTTHNTAWYERQCVQPRCFSGTAGCDQPR
jgi:hypothetical protein